MTWKDLARKLTSRKLWMAIAGFVAGRIGARGEGGELAGTVAGVSMGGGSGLG